MQNPFNINFGKEPNSIISRGNELNEIYESFSSDNPFSNVFILTGIRGSGKTVAMTNIFKHYKDGMKYIYNGDVAPDFDETYKNESIENKIYQSIPDVYKYALDMTTREVYQAVEGMYHNLNTLQSRSGNQLPFTSINYGTCTLPEGRMVTKALLDVSIEGIGALHKTSIFPCGIFQCMKGVNREPGDPNYDLYKLAL